MPDSSPSPLPEGRGHPQAYPIGDDVATPSLTGEILRQIDKNGPLDFAAFMELALYEPTLGYYARHTRQIGRHGDFFTSVNVGPVFGRLLCFQFMEMRKHLGDPADFTLVEQGANDGRLMADILSAWEGPMPRVLIVEPLENLRVMQRETLTRWSGYVSQVTHESELPEFRGVFFANELLDAFPVRLFARENGHWNERRVAFDGDRFIFCQTPLDKPPPFVSRVPEEAPQFVAEDCPSMQPWMNTVAGKLNCGWMLLVDYGHPAAVRYHPARAEGTLAAYRGHRRQDDPLGDPGSQDLTSHVDFTAVAEAADKAGLQIAGFTDQHHALTALAAHVFPAMREEKISSHAEREMRALRQLLHPESMGTSFKFLAFSKNTGSSLTAFEFARDARRELFA